MVVEEEVEEVDGEAAAVAEVVDEEVEEEVDLMKDHQIPLRVIGYCYHPEIV